MKQPNVCIMKFFTFLPLKTRNTPRKKKKSFSWVDLVLGLLLSFIFSLFDEWQQLGCSWKEMQWYLWVLPTSDLHCRRWLCDWYHKQWGHQQHPYSKRKSRHGNALDRQCPRSEPWSPCHRSPYSESETPHRWWLWNSSWIRCVRIWKADWTCRRPSPLSTPPWIDSPRYSPHHHQGKLPFPSPPPKQNKTKQKQRTSTTTTTTQHHKNSIPKPDLQKQCSQLQISTKFGTKCSLSLSLCLSLAILNWRVLIKTGMIHATLVERLRFGCTSLCGSWCCNATREKDLQIFHTPLPQTHFTSFANKNTTTYENIGKLQNYTLFLFFCN